MLMGGHTVSCSLTPSDCPARHHEVFDQAHVILATESGVSCEEDHEQQHILCKRQIRFTFDLVFARPRHDTEHLSLRRFK